MCGIIPPLPHTSSQRGAYLSTETSSPVSPLKYTYFKDTMLRGIRGPKKNEVTEVWRKLHNETLRNVYASRVVK
jgi:hypothetical protein